MNREIKFRVWDNVDYMTSTFTLHDLMFSEIEFTTDCPIMQFTGLKDSTGADIYEGDIVIVTEPASNGMAEIVHNPVAVTLHEEIAGFNLGYVSNTMENFYDYEVIGNVHQNPDILGIVQK